MAPFGASWRACCFSLPASPLSQPMNVIGGHVVSTLVGLLLPALSAERVVAVAIRRFAISFMALLRVTHPPAGRPHHRVRVGSGLCISAAAGLAGARRVVAIRGRLSCDDIDELIRSTNLRKESLMARLVAEKHDVVPKIAEIFGNTATKAPSLSLITGGTGWEKPASITFFPEESREMAQVILDSIDAWFEENIL